MRLAHRLLLGAALLVSLLVLLVVALSGEQLKRQLLSSLIAQLDREARYVAEEWRDGIDPDSLANTVGAITGHRITLVRPDGRVVGDSEFHGAALAGLDDHGTRPEIIEARERGVAFLTRTSGAVGDERLYVAARGPNGVARASVPIQQLNQGVNRARRNVLASGLAALVLALVVAYAFSREVSRPLIELRDVAQALAAGDLSRRPALSAPGEIGDLAAALHRMAEQLDTRLRALQGEEALLVALIDSLNEGVIAVDSRRNVIAVNHVGRRLLGVQHETPFSVDMLPRERELREAIQSALAGRATEQAELHIDDRVLTLTARSLEGGGAVVALFDLTALRRLEAVRRDFVANVSHELKTPLTIIGGFAETLSGDDVPAAQQRQFAETIRANAVRMQRIVDDLLDLSRIESGGWVPNPARLDVRVAAEEALLAVHRTAAERRIALVTDIAADATHVRVDPTAMRQILSNLVDNALRYTPEGGMVTVSSHRNGDGVVVGLRDTGTGIAPEHLPRIFERFYRADPARSREAGGTGLGLAIVKHLVESHGGRVWAESRVDEGTVVFARFPDAETVTLA